MWPRVIEGMLGAWLMLTPFVFRGTEAVGDFVTSSIVSGLVIAVASLLAFWEPTRHARFLTLAVSLWLSLHGYFGAERPGPPAAQNELVLGLTLLLFAIMPNEVNEVPRPWRRSRRA
jgi:hypothetical protein